MIAGAYDERNMAQQCDRFVIQEHHAPGGVHWDLMLEDADGLWTWQLAAPPADPTTAWPIAAAHIFKHRKAYLDYEGSISGNRGWVRIYDVGRFRLERSDDGRWEFELRGRRMAGSYALTRRQDDQWEFCRRG